MDRKLIFWAGLVVAVGILLGCALLWQPERQVRLHQRHLLRALENRNWKQVEKMLAPAYSDRWHHDKAGALNRSREVLRQFFSLSIRESDPVLRMEPAAGVYTASLSLSGNGGPAVEFILERVNSLREPFVFRWEKSGTQPWEWHLVSVDQPQLVLPGY